MLYLLIITIVFLVFYIAGFFFACDVVSKNENFKLRDFLPKKKKIEHIKIRDKFTDTGNALSDLICEVTEENLADYVEANRLKQNKAYNYVKIKEVNSNDNG